MRYSTLSMLTTFPIERWRIGSRKTYGHKVYSGTLRQSDAERDSWSCEHAHKSEREANDCAMLAVEYIAKQIARGR